MVTMRSLVKCAVIVILTGIWTISGVSADPVPAGIDRQLLKGYEVLSNVHISAAVDRRFYIIALGRNNEDVRRVRKEGASARPLLIFEQRGGRFILIGRNDRVVLRADEGGQCDPFLDGGGTIAVKGSYFTVENGVACGQHWTDYVTFRFDNRHGFVFDNERTESWTMNQSHDPNAEALVREGPPTVRRDKLGHVTAFSAWHPSR